MNFHLIKAVVELVQQFTQQNEGKSVYNNDLQGFVRWISESRSEAHDPNWIGKESGRSPESIINTLLIRMGRYAKSYSKSAVGNSVFSSQDDFIYLIGLKTKGAMTKMELIHHNAHEKSAGILIINRLIHHGWVAQSVSETDKRAKYINITEKGLAVLEEHMKDIRKASRVVVGNLSHSEQMLLIIILSKLDEFHDSLYRMNLEVKDLLDEAYKKLN